MTLPPDPQPPDTTPDPNPPPPDPGSRALADDLTGHHGDRDARFSDRVRWRNLRLTERPGRWQALRSPLRNQPLEDPSRFEPGTGAFQLLGICGSWCSGLSGGGIAAMMESPTVATDSFAFSLRSKTVGDVCRSASGVRGGHKRDPASAETPSSMGRCRGKAG
jgi:hypothetical protein